MRCTHQFQMTKFIFKKKDMNIPQIHTLPFTIFQFQDLGVMMDQEDLMDQLVIKDQMAQEAMMDHKDQKAREAQEEIKDL